MKQLRFLKIPTSTETRIPCPAGHRVRIEAVWTTLTVVGDGEQVSVEMGLLAADRLIVASNPLFLAQAVDYASFALGHSYPQLGGTTDTQRTTAPLPELWWDTEFNLIVLPSGSMTLGSEATVVYTDEWSLTGRQPRVRSKRSP